MSTDSRPAPVASPPARWKIRRTGGNSFELLVSADPACHPVRFPMSAEELYYLTHNCDRLLSWTLPEVEGTFTQPVATPEEVRAQLSIGGWVVTSPTLEAHTRLVQATAYATWVEEVPAREPGEVAWFVNVFAPDDDQFWQACVTHGATREPGAYEGQPGGGDDG